MPKWTEPKYPGDAVRILMLKRGHGVNMQLGDIRIQHYGLTVTVGTFLPGQYECSPGDTPKVWPESSVTLRADNQADAADEVFDDYVGKAYADGWQNYNPNGDTRDSNTQSKT